MPRQTILDIAKRNGSDAIVGMIDETTRVHPEMRLIDARTITGTSFKTLVRTGLGSAGGAFRSLNTGVDLISHSYENRTVETYTFEPRSEVDKAVADRSEDGPNAFIAVQESGTLESSFQTLCQQFYYGTGPGGNPVAFPGLLQSYDPVNKVIDAGGTAANTGTSVWLIRTGVQDVRWVWGANGIMGFGDPTVETLRDANNKAFRGYVSTFLAYPGLQVGSQRTVVRIKNITAEAGKTLTDRLMTLALMLFPAGMGPDLILMTQRSVGQLQQSRTATTPTGAQADFPSKYVGLAGAIDLQITEAISNTEPLTL